MKTRGVLRPHSPHYCQRLIAHGHLVSSRRCEPRIQQDEFRRQRRLVGQASIVPSLTLLFSFFRALLTSLLPFPLFHGQPRRSSPMLASPLPPPAPAPLSFDVNPDGRTTGDEPSANESAMDARLGGEGAGRRCAQGTGVKRENKRKHGPSPSLYFRPRDTCAHSPSSLARCALLADLAPAIHLARQRPRDPLDFDLQQICDHGCLDRRMSRRESRTAFGVFVSCDCQPVSSITAFDAPPIPTPANSDRGRIGDRW